MIAVPESVRAARVPILAELLPFYRLCPDDSLVATVIVATIHLDDDVFALACRRALTRGDHRNPIREILEAAKALRRPDAAKA